MNTKVLGAATMLPLVIGVTANVASTTSTTSSARSSHKSSACVVRLTSCPEFGCAAEDTPDGLSNTLKRTMPTGNKPRLLTVDDFSTLQGEATKRVGDKKAALSASQRQKLHAMPMHGGKISEGDLVAVAGFIVGDPHPNTGESVNCNLHGASNNDIHITIASEAGSDEMDGFVVEMIPENRPDGWTKAALESIERKAQQVLVVGQLFYDSKHHVNDDPDNPLSGDPKRMSLFEVHPIVRFLVCDRAKTCDPANEGAWTKIEDLAQP
ncbi:MAG TPA: hypothetical protein VJN70_12465 [Gemmatimonadaceae bacterium]|nr:hypothetical protein [Gemmatimonadaceae bacterium]